MSKSVQIRNLQLHELHTLVDWARQEGWNPGLHDADIFYASDPEGFLGYFVEDELIGGGSIVSYNGRFGFMGFFIVLPAFRSKGIGTQLWLERRNRLLSRLQPGAAIGMDGVVSMQPFYQKGGFQIAFRDERYELKGHAFAVHPNVSGITAGDFESILQYDKQCFGFPRRTFMELWLQQPGLIAFKFEENGQLQGFALMRKAHIGYKICPLFAENEQVAESLLRACINAIGEDALYIDIPVINTAAVLLMKKYDGKYVFECARMYLGNAPKLPVHQIFGITTFELG